ncbi:hypothetical protein VMCG_06515 [Cytospora schulzeri]|uniref:Aminoglycoside phosphotransferase domain-containing protein n=1 Tax=Cytospora schulzeri TaxID=448051 RepID=A0A423WBZ5_9PEZI|nr:hypothetical protein VMCG_06515 [Valsa malicola]
MAPSEPQRKDSRELPRRLGRARLIRLGDGLLMKASDEVRSSQSAAMEYVQKHAPSVPVPAVHHTDFAKPGDAIIIMDEIPGDNLETVWPSLDASQKEQVCKNIWRIIMTLRKLPRPNALYSTVDGSPMYHHGLLGNEFAPVPKNLLKSDDAFRGFILQRYNEYHGSDQDIKRNFPRSEAAVFTHGDIKPKNIMVSKDGHINSLLDWEYSGFMPDYWEAAGMFNDVWTAEREWAAIMQQTKPKNWDYDIARLRKTQNVLHF